MPLQRGQSLPPPPYHATSTLVKQCLGCTNPVGEANTSSGLATKTKMAQRERHPTNSAARAPRRGQPRSSQQRVSRNTATDTFWGTYGNVGPCHPLHYAFKKLLPCGQLQLQIDAMGVQHGLHFTRNSIGLVALRHTPRYELEQRHNLFRIGGCHVKSTQSPLSTPETRSKTGNLTCTLAETNAPPTGGRVGCQHFLSVAQYLGPKRMPILDVQAVHLALPLHR